MNYFTGTISYSSTGTKTLSIGFQPTLLRITVSSSFGGADSYVHYCTGWTDGTSSFYHSLFADGSGRQSINGSGKLVSHYERSGSTLTEVLAVTFNSFTATQAKINVTTANPNYQLFIEAMS